MYLSEQTKNAQVAGLEAAANAVLADPGRPEVIDQIMLVCANGQYELQVAGHAKNSTVQQRMVIVEGVAEAIKAAMAGTTAQ